MSFFDLPDEYSSFPEKVIQTFNKFYRTKTATLTQEELSERLDVAPEYVSRIENGRAQINLKRLGEISALLDVPIEYFVAGSVCSGDDDIQALVSAAGALNQLQRAHLVRIAQEIQQLAQDC